MDANVLEKAKAGDRTALGQIVDAYYKDAYLFALSIAGDVHDAMDVCQDSFIKVFRNIKKLRDNDSFKSWIMKIVSNTAKDVFRTRKPAEMLRDDMAEVFTEESLLDRKDLMDALMNLKKEYRQVLVLRYINDMKIKDVAKILRIPQNTVKSRIRYALEQARTILEGDKK